MSATITLWTSSSTTLAQNRVANLVGDSSGARGIYDAVSIAGHSAAEASDKINSAFNRLVNLTMPDATLHIVAVVPLYEADSIEQINLLHEACSRVKHRISLHILGLASGVRSLFDSNKENDSPDSDNSSAIDSIVSICNNAAFSISYSLIDDYAENGAPIGFNIETLSRYIALIQVALMQDYYKILSPALLAPNPCDNLAIGVASLTFDRKATARQLLGRGFVEALDNVGINDKEVDAQKAARTAESFLYGIDRRYPKLFNSSIRPLYKEYDLDEGKVVAKASDILDDDIRSLKDEILGLLSDDSLSLPEKEAVLALILGRDNENIRGMQYQHEGALLDDVCEEPINLYVDAFNSYCIGSKLLPVRKEYEALKEYEWNEAENKLVESKKNKEALNPIPDIKRLKQDIINITSYIRDKNDQLDDLRQSMEQRKDVEDIKKTGHRPKGNLRDVDYKEQPLDDKYVPTPGLQTKDTVDLRKFFSPVKNQKDLGSCTSFAAASMYEAMMSIEGVEGADMSPAYLYYYSNILQGRPSGGSNFFEQLKVLGSNGICREDLYAYDSESPEIAPSQQADEDAALHRVIQAKQIPIVNEHDKSDTIKRNHVLLTSALSEGFPIGISLKVYDNLGDNGAFVLHPEDTPDAKEDGWHAMVIAGYDNKNDFYIVRNSWGPEFGEDGYCYIPSAYIDDPDYMNFACIITQISDNAEGPKADIPTVIANFAATEAEIRMAAIRNAIAKMRIDLKSAQKKYADYYKYYQQLMLQLAMPQVQNKITLDAKVAQALTVIDVERRKRELENSFVAKIKEHKKKLKYIIASLFVMTLSFAIGWYYSQSAWTFIAGAISAAFLALTFCGYKWWKKIKRRELQDELDQVAVDARNQAERLFELQMRFHIAGMWIDRFHKLSIEIGNVYDRLTCYNACLRDWQLNYSHEIGDVEEPEGQMFRSLNPSPLLQSFFEQNKSEIVRQVDLIRLFDNYKAKPDRIEEYRQNLEDVVTAVIDALMADFNVAEFLLGDRYPYLAPVSLQDEMSALINVGQPAFRNNAMNATSPIRILMANVPLERQNQWTSGINPLFPLNPLQLQIVDPTTLILITIHPQHISVV